jgi:hypothetical protein
LADREPSLCRVQPVESRIQVGLRRIQVGPNRREHRIKLSGLGATNEDLPASCDRRARSRHAGAPFGDIVAGSDLARFGELQVFGGEWECGRRITRKFGHGNSSSLQQRRHRHAEALAKRFNTGSDGRLRSPFSIIECRTSSDACPLNDCAPRAARPP